MHMFLRCYKLREIERQELAQPVRIPRGIHALGHGLRWPHALTRAPRPRWCCVR
jgi:hypothetical protein